MDVDDGIDRLVRKGLAEGLSDDEIRELLTDHNVSRDQAESILDDVKDALSTSEKNAREALADKTPGMSEPNNAPNIHSGTDGEEKFEKSFTDEVDNQPSMDSSTADEAGSFEELDSTHESDEERKSFDEFEEDIQEDNENDGDGGIFSRLTGLFSSNEETDEEDESTSPPETEKFSEEVNTNAKNQPPENPNWDVEALNELAVEAIDKGLAEEEILSLFIDHGVPESYTTQLLENAKEGRDEEREDDETEEAEQEETEEQADISATKTDTDETKPSEQDDVPDDQIDDLDLDDIADDAESDEGSEQSFEDVFEDEAGTDGGMTNKSTDLQAPTQSAAEPEKINQGQEAKEQEVSTQRKSSETNVSAAKLDQETLQAMAQHGIAKGFDRAELVAFFEDHGIEEERATRIINTVLPSDNQNTQGRKKSEQEGHTETSDAKDAVAVQKQEQVTTVKDEDESFMSDMDKNQESLKVGRIYLTGRKPSYGRMQVQGLQDITGDEFESGGRTGFIDLSDTEEHIAGQENGSADDSQQVDNDRIRDQA